VSVFLSCFQDRSRVLGLGELGKVFVVAVDKAQAKIVFNYILGKKEFVFTPILSMRPLLVVMVPM